MKTPSLDNNKHFEYNRGNENIFLYIYMYDWSLRWENLINN